MNKADIARIRKHLENYVKLLESSTYARGLCEVDTEALNQIRRDIEKTKQWGANKQ